MLVRHFPPSLLFTLLRLDSSGSSGTFSRFESRESRLASLRSSTRTISHIDYIDTTPRPAHCKQVAPSAGIPFQSTTSRGITRKRHQTRDRSRIPRSTHVHAPTHMISADRPSPRLHRVPPPRSFYPAKWLLGLPYRTDKDFPLRKYTHVQVLHSLCCFLLENSP